jgi:putative transposase
MSRYRRVKIEGGISFFTLALADRGNDLLVRHIERLRSAYAGVQRRLPFTTVAICILPDHIHTLWQLPDGDADYASRWSLFKSAFSRGLAPAPTRSASNITKREKGIWQRRYWEHGIRGDQLCHQRPMEADLNNPNLGRPDFQFSYSFPKELDEPFAILEHLPFNRLLKPPVLRRQK